MKSIVKSGLSIVAASMVMLMISQPAFAQTCTEGAGLTNITSTTSGHSAVGQNFTANCAGGQITAITIVWDTSASILNADHQLNIYDGSDWTATVLHTQVIPFASIADGAATYAINPPVPINSGEVNSFEITAVGGGEAAGIATGVVYGSDVYPAGEPFWSRSFGFSSLDLAFLVELNGTGEVEPTALFRVSKEYTDGADEAAEVTLTCNAGIPLTQSFVLKGGNPDSVTFTVTNLPASGADCVVTETGGADNYTAVMNDGAGCSWTNVNAGLYDCVVKNSPSTFDFVVDFEWDDTATDATGYVDVSLYCTNVLNSNGTLDTTTRDGGSYTADATSDTEFEWLAVGAPNDDEDSDGDPINPTTCWAEVDYIDDMTVEVMGCDPFTVSQGEDEANCTMTASVFFEGIPTISQFGMAIMVLLMLGVGFVGMRRFV